MSISVSTNFAGRELTIETGKMAQQAGGAVTVRYGDTIVLVTATAQKEPKKDADFFPLTVAYVEKTFAAGKIPGGFFKREGRPSEDETLTGRFIDRPIRPLFPENFTNETQVIATVLSADIENEPDVMAMIGASASLCISPIPFAGPIAGVRVGRVSGKLIINPTPSQVDESDLDVVVAASRESVVMVEGGAKILPEEDVLAAILFAHKEMQPLFDLQDELIKKCNVKKWEVEKIVINEELKKKVEKEAGDKIRKTLQIVKKLERYEAFDILKKETIENLTTEENRSELAPEISEMFSEIKKDHAREMILKGKRIDGRTSTDIRQITCEVGLLPRVHGSALFTRGETQALAATTLGTADDQQRIDSIGGEYHKRFMLHYNFPPFSVGEVKPMRSPGRREIGHGALAERALLHVMPEGDDFPYTVRIVSEVLASNGSSSMATVCSGSMALMDAGVKIKDQVAGIAMGLIKEGDKYVILSDILGDEDHLGDMDFKVTGTKDGVTALQMDIKIAGISGDILQKALKQAKEGRLHILSKMNECIATAREELSPYAPKIIGLKIDVSRIKDLIGSGGKTINKIIAETGVKINVEDDGSVQIAAIDSENTKRALKMIKAVTSSPDVGKYYHGEVVKIMDFGAFVRIMPNVDGLVHISELAPQRVAQVSDVVREGDLIVVKVLEVDASSGKIRLSKKAAEGYTGEIDDMINF